MMYLIELFCFIKLFNRFDDWLKLLMCIMWNQITDLPLMEMPSGKGFSLRNPTVELVVKSPVSLHLLCAEASAVDL